jgi:hypothetical protein
MVERGEHTPLWLSHHWPHDFDRCIEVRGRMVCRRCAVLYPLAVMSAALLAVAPWPDAVDPWLIWLLPLPSFAEFVAEHLGWIEHSPRRLVLTTVPLAVGCGRLYVRYLDDPGDPIPFVVVFGYGLVCLAVALLSARRQAPQPLDEVPGVGEGAGVVVPQARGGEQRQHREGEADGPP